MNNLIKIQNEPGLLKDPVSKAVINNDIVGYQNYVKQRTRMSKDKEKIAHCEQQIGELIKEISELRDAFKQIITCNINSNKP